MMEAVEQKTILSPGEIIGSYRIENFLGQGGFGVTYLALDTNLQLQVAIKEYFPEQIAERTQDNSVQPKSATESGSFTWGLTRFIREARTLAKFNHPNIVRVMCVFECNGTAYIVMGYEQGQDLKSLLNTPGNHSEFFLKSIIAPVLDGLTEVHKHGYIHRDIKPANILIRNNGTPVLLDFGSARQASGSKAQNLTALVSAGYAPLEQYNESNDSQQGPWTDIYALGAVLYYAITGNAPVDSTVRGTAVLNDRPDPLSSLSSLQPRGVSPSFCKAIDWALNFKVNKRPQSIEQWRSNLLYQTETKELPYSSAYAVEPGITTQLAHTARNQSHVSQAGISTNSTAVTKSRAMPGNLHGSEYGKAHSQTPHKSDISQIPPYTHASRRKPPHKHPARNTHRIFRYGSLVACTALALLIVGLADLWLPHAQQYFQTSTVNTPSTNSDDSTPETRKSEPATRQGVTITTTSEQKIQKRQASEQVQTIPKSLVNNKTALAHELEISKQNAEREREIARIATAEQDRLNAVKSAENARLSAQRAIDKVQQTRKRMEQQKVAAIENRQRVAAAAIVPKKTTIVDNKKKYLSNSAEPDSTRAITNTDMSLVLGQFHKLVQAIQNKNADLLRELTVHSSQKQNYFDYLFSEFDSIEVSLISIHASKYKQTIRSALKIERLKRSNGDIAIPSPELQNIPIHSTRLLEWSRIYW